MKQNKVDIADLPDIRVEVLEVGARRHKGWVACEIGTNVQFNTEKMESYFFAQWEPVLYDALLLAAAVEFSDRSLRRSGNRWGRDIELRVSVHEPARWEQLEVTHSLHEALEFLTGDRWQVSFMARTQREAPPRQGLFRLGRDKAAVLPFSDGLDSCAVAGLMSQKLGDKLVRIRLGSKSFEGGTNVRHRQPCTSVPYKVRAGEREFSEPSARSRGFKFSLLSGLAAYLARAAEIIVPESGQGALGPTLVAVGQAYADYRSHPLFTGRMEKFIAALLGYRVKFAFPQLWQTKGETISHFIRECGPEGQSWKSTWSCWQQTRHVSVDRKKRQCGICAACVLRRMSVHAAGLAEKRSAYVWEDLSAPTFDRAAAASFGRKKITRAMREYAIAGTLHFDHLAGLRHSHTNEPTIDLGVYQLSKACELPEAETRTRLDRMLRRHESEWKDFVASLGPNSFVSDWAAHAR